MIGMTGHSEPMVPVAASRSVVATPSAAVISTARRRVLSGGAERGRGRVETTDGTERGRGLLRAAGLAVDERRVEGAVMIPPGCVGAEAFPASASHM